MTTADKIGNRLIDKILSIKNEKFLLALEDLIASSDLTDRKISLTDEQKLMLQMSERDIYSNQTVSHQEFKEKTTQWLKNQERDVRWTNTAQQQFYHILDY